MFAFRSASKPASLSLGKQQCKIRLDRCRSVDLRSPESDPLSIDSRDCAHGRGAGTVARTVQR
eukprot:7294119-Alexandrium_andersonii.AAC.1